VTVSFNQGRFLERTLQSVLAQRAEILEYIVVDGGSTDESVAILERYQDRLDYWHSRRDEGQSDAINQGFARAKGDVLYWINSDDLLLPGAIAAVRRAFRSPSRPDVVTGWHLSIDEESRIIGVHRIPGDGARRAAWGVVHVCQPSTFFRRRLFEKVGGLDRSLHCVMDTDLWLRMMSAGASFGHVRHFLSAFRMHAKSKGTSWGPQYAEERALLRKRFPQYFGDGPRFRIGRLAYGAARAATGGYLRDWMSGRFWQGGEVEEVFGERRVPAVPGRPSARSRTEGDGSSCTER
jgi:GT2 family glycosyltransferase